MKGPGIRIDARAQRLPHDVVYGKDMEILEEMRTVSGSDVVTGCPSQGM